MVDDRPARKTTTATTTTTTKPSTTTILTTEATTLETVKNPIFRIHPPSWVDGARTTTSKKLTTRIFRNEITTPLSEKIGEVTVLSFTTPMVETAKPSDGEFFTSPTLVPTIKHPSTIEATKSLNTKTQYSITDRDYAINKKFKTTTVYMTNVSKKQELYLLNSTQTTAVPTQQSTYRKPNITYVPELIMTQSQDSITTASPVLIPSNVTTKVLSSPKPSIITSPEMTIPTQASPFVEDSTFPLSSAMTTATIPLTTVTASTTVTSPTTAASTLLLSQETTENITEVIATKPTHTTAATVEMTETPPTTIRAQFPTKPTTPYLTTTTTAPPITSRASDSTSPTETVVTVTTLPTITTPMTSTTPIPSIIKMSPATEIPSTKNPDTPQISTLAISPTIPSTIASQNTNGENGQINSLTYSRVTKQNSSKESTLSDTESTRMPTISPEFKVIKVIKTDQSTHRSYGLLTTKYQTPYPAFTRTTLLTEHDPLIKVPVTTRIRTDLNHQKTKENGSPIIYINPTLKETGTLVDSTKRVFISKTLGTTSPITTLKSPGTMTFKNSGLNENEIPVKPSESADDKFETKLPVITPDDTPQRINKPSLNSLFSEPDMYKELKATSVEGDKQSKSVGTVFPTIKVTEGTEDINIPISQKKKPKDITEKENEENTSINNLKKIAQEDMTTTLSPIYILKQLLNATIKPRITTILPLYVSISEKPPEKVFEDDFTKEIINKKAKYDDLIIPYLAPEKNKKKHEKMKQNKLGKEGKDHSVTSIKQDKQPEIPATPFIITESAANQNVSHSPSSTKVVAKPTYHDVTVRKEILPSPRNVTLPSTTYPNKIWPVTVTRVKTKVTHASTTEIVVETATAKSVNSRTTQKLVEESNTIDTLQTSFEEVPKKDLLEEEQEDSNYSIINNKMKLVKTETHYGAAGMTGAIPSKTFAGMIIILGVSIITLIALAGTLWVYLKRQRDVMAVQQFIMAYELPEPTQRGIYYLIIIINV